MVLVSLLVGALLLNTRHAVAVPSPSTTERTEAASPVGTRVTLDYGTFNGLADKKNNMISFRGVRFADPPVGDLRWRQAVMPPTKHMGTVSAKQFGAACIETTQTDTDDDTSEDCLFGNVFIPMNTSVDDNLPVMIWFHGGGFQGGDTHDASPEHILQSSAKPMIFASFEYRLGQFGFLGGSEVKANGALNAGLLDQRTALRWVQRYISKFGGDPSRVTIWGQSAGAGSTMFQLIANKGDHEGLFRAAMGDSPSLSFVPAFNEAYDEGIYQQFATLAGCATNSTADSLKCLRSASSISLIRAGSSLINSRSDTLYSFAPILDGDFICDRPVEAFKAGRFARVPVFFGSNTNEGANWSASISDPNANTSSKNATEATVYSFLSGQWASLTNSTFQQLVGIYPLKQFNNSFSLQGQQMYGEARYICTAAMITGAAKAFDSGPAYQYHYDNPHLGSNHANELDAFFSPPGNANAADNALFEAMREYWSSFVTTGKPVAKSAAEWEPVSEDTGDRRMFLNPSGIKMEDMGALIDRCSFWHGISGEMQT
ncbi:alpha/beta-hydrolase [Agrocybe pediades]|nr:alpha/beta-hydrolase [Agrocybe pediades]